MNQIDPGEGWRLIDKEKDVKKPGDEYYWQQGWHAAGCNVGFQPGHIYRRRIEQIEPVEGNSTGGEGDK